MTPIKEFVLEGFNLYAVDMTDHKTLIATAANADQARWLLWTCSEFHHVEGRQED